MRNQQIVHAESVCKLHKLIPLLGSEASGEVVATAAAIDHRAGPSELTGRDLMHCYSADDIEADRAQGALYGSLCRVIEGAPVQNKLPVFGMMARTAAAETSAFRQQIIDDLWLVAEDLGLVALVGDTNVQEVLATAFARNPS